MDFYTAFRSRTMWLSLCLWILFLGTLTHVPGTIATPLDDYVNRPDPTYAYTVINNMTGPGYVIYTVNMTSQTWKPGTLNIYSVLLFYMIKIKRCFKWRNYRGEGHGGPGPTSWPVSIILLI